MAASNHLEGMKIELLALLSKKAINSMDDMNPETDRIIQVIQLSFSLLKHGEGKFLYENKETLAPFVQDASCSFDGNSHMTDYLEKSHIEAIWLAINRDS